MDDDDVIYIGAGTFTEPELLTLTALVNIWDLRVTIQGAGRDRTILDAGGIRSGFVVQGTSEVTIRRLTVRNTGGTAPGSCISHRSTGRMTVQEVLVHNCVNSGIEQATSAALHLIDVVSRDNTELPGMAVGGQGVSGSGPLTIERGSFTGNETHGILHDQLEMIGGLVQGNGHEGILAGQGSLTDVIIQDNGNDPGLLSKPPGLAVRGAMIVRAVTIQREGACLQVLEVGELTLVDGVLRNCEREGLKIDTGGRATVERTVIAESARRFGFQAVENRGNLTLIDSVVESNQHGAIRNTGELVLRNVWVRGNRSYRGALENYGQAIVESSLFSGNRVIAIEGGGGVGGVNNAGMMRLTNSTISGNEAAGLWANPDLDPGFELVLAFVTITSNAIGLEFDGVTQISNSLIVGNGDDCRFLESPRPLPQAGLNFDSDGRCGLARSVPATGLGLGPLEDNGGPTRTHALLAGSPALDAASGPCPASDQRGAGRPHGSACDVGAYEFNPLFTARGAAAEGTVEPTVVVGPPLATFRQNTNCRAGPGTLYGILHTFLAGQTAPVEGRSSGEPRWWWLLIPGTSAHCWASDTTLELDRPGEELPVMVPPPPPTATAGPQKPAAPEKLAITGEVCNASEYLVTLGWVDAAGNETGYRVYRDGSLIATLGANAVGYTDDPPGSGPYTYGVEAYNAAGASARPTVYEDGCLY